MHPVLSVLFHSSQCWWVRSLQRMMPAFALYTKTYQAELWLLIHPSTSVYWFFQWLKSRKNTDQSHSLKEQRDHCAEVWDSAQREEITWGFAHGHWFPPSSCLLPRASTEDRTVHLRAPSHNEMDNPIFYLQDEINKNFFSSTGLPAQQRQGSDSGMFWLKCAFFSDALSLSSAY